MGNKINIQKGDGNSNTQIDIFRDDLGVINEIYAKILGKKNYTFMLKKDFNHVKLNEKILLNINDEKERIDLFSLCENIYDKIYLIEETFGELDIDKQKEITIDIKEMYNKKMSENQNNTILALRDLFVHYTPESKIKNPTYNNIGRAFVLFFFDDCTIGKKI